MLLLSFCKNFDSRFFFSPEPRLRDSCDYDFRNERTLEWLQFLTKDKNVLFLIHGYNSPEQGAVRSYQTIEANLKTHGMSEAYDVIVGVLWPAHTALGFWAAESAADRAGRLLGGILGSLEAKSVDIEAHSLGNRVLLEALKSNEKLITPSPDKIPLVHIRNAILWAAAVNDESLELDNRYYLASWYTKNLLVGYSKNDGVLGRYYRRFSVPLVLNDLALGYNGPTQLQRCVPWLTLEDGTDYVKEHSAWRDSPEAYAAWRKLL